MRNFTERLLQFRPNFKSRVSHSFTFTDCNTGHGDLDLLSKNAVLALDSKIPLLKLTGRWKLHLERIWQMTGCVPHSIQAWLQVALSPVSACTNLALHRRFKPRNQQGMLSFWAPSSSLQWLCKWLHSRLLESVQQLARTLPTRYIQPNAFLWEQKAPAYNGFAKGRFRHGISCSTLS